MLAQLPAVIELAHERFIGERPVLGTKKILRVYEPDVQTVVRDPRFENRRKRDKLYLTV